MFSFSLLLIIEEMKNAKQHISIHEYLSELPIERLEGIIQVFAEILLRERIKEIENEKLQSKQTNLRN